MKRKPTRRDLLIVIGRLQNLIGNACSAYMDDRAESRAERVQEPLNEAHDLCVEARSYDAPIEARLGPWGEP